MAAFPARSGSPRAAQGDEERVWPLLTALPIAEREQERKTEEHTSSSCCCPWTGQARCEAVRREREMRRREGEWQSQSQASGRLGGGKTEHSMCKASRQPFCRE
jgi:hypothetical protein